VTLFLLPSTVAIYSMLSIEMKEIFVWIIVGARKCVCREEDSFALAFDLMDSGRSGFLEPSTLRRHMSAVGLGMTDDIFNETFNVDGARKARVRRSDFVQQCKRLGVKDSVGVALVRAKLMPYAVGSILVLTLATFVVLFAIDANVKTTFITSAYFVAISVTSVGLGDIVPDTGRRLTAAFLLTISLAVISMALNLVIGDSSGGNGDGDATDSSREKTRRQIAMVEIEL
jgi:hypothetical protein